MDTNIKILLIECEKSFLGSEESKVNKVMLPIGLMYLSSFLKKNVTGAIVETDLIDLAVDNLDSETLRAISPIPNIVGLRGLTANRDIVHNVAKLVKKEFPDSILILGGPYSTSDFKSALQDINIDFAVTGEGEYPFVDVVNCMLEGRRLEIRKIQGVVYLNKESEKLITNHEQKKPDLNAQPLPDYSIINLNKYSQVICNAKVKRKQAIIVASRGCPFQCIYCHKIFGKQVRVRTAESVFHEVEHLYRNYDIRDFFFVDDVFNISHRRIIEFCSLIKKSGIKPKLYFQNGFRADICNKEAIDALVDAGMILVNFALETATPRLQKLIKKNVNIAKLADIVHYTCSKDIIVGLNIMVGFPTETYEEAEATVEFLKQFKKLSLPFFFVARYYPNTEMYNLAIKMGAKSSELDAPTQKVYHDVSLPTPTFSPDQLNKLLLKYMLEVFFDKARLVNTQRILEKHYSNEDIKDFYSTLLNRKITDVEKQVLSKGRDNQAA